MTILEGMLESFKLFDNVEVTMLSDLPHIDRPRYETKVKIIDVRKYLHLSSYFSNRNRIVKVPLSLLFLSQHLFFLILCKVFKLRALKLMKSEIWKAYVESDLIILGHNGAFGIGGGLGAPIVFYPLFVPLFAKMLNKPVAFYGGSIGGVRRFHWLLSKIFNFALNKMDLITLRERISSQNSDCHNSIANNRYPVATTGCVWRQESFANNVNH